MRKAIVVGAGLAGLSAAVRLVEAGFAIEIAEAATQAGGRCRSYHDAQLGLTIDNGNHLVLAGNHAVARFRQTVGAHTPLAGPDHANFAFADLLNGRRWTIGINDGPLPWWVLSTTRRVPGSRFSDYLPLARLLAMAPSQTVGQRIQAKGPVWDRLLEPVLLAVLNTPPAEGSAALTAAVLRETLLRGGKASLPRIAEPTLAAAFVDPALEWLAARGAPVTFGKRLRGIELDGGRATALDWGDERQAITGETVVLAVPPWIAKGLLPQITAPNAFNSIVNAHFACPPPADAPPMLALLHAKAQWLFALPDRISVTVSAADDIVGTDREALACTFWDEIQRAYGFTAPMPAWQVVKEKRATFAATPAQDALRPQARTRWQNLLLAGDWVQTGLPATIEGALRSGETAAGLAIAAQQG